MADPTRSRGRPRSATPKSAKTRKSEFDARMRNAGQRIDPSQPERSPCTFYLSAEAKQEVVRHRNASKLVSSPMADSQYVESLLSAQARAKPKSSAPAFAVADTQAEPYLFDVNDPNQLLTDATELLGRLQDVRKRARRYNDQLLNELSGVHRRQQFAGFDDLASQIEKLCQSGRDQMRIKWRMHTLIDAYLRDLARDIWFDLTDATRG